MQTTVIQSRARLSSSQLIQNLSRKVSDSTIASVLERNVSEFDPDSCVQALRALSWTSKRSCSMVRQKGILENHNNWKMVTERLTKRVLDDESLQLNSDSFRQFCFALSKLRIGDSQKLLLLSHTLKHSPANYIAVLQHAAETDAGMKQVVDYDRLLRMLSNKKEDSTVIFAPTIATCLSMFLASEFKIKSNSNKTDSQTTHCFELDLLMNPLSDLAKVNQELWKALDSMKDKLKPNDLDDLSNCIPILLPPPIKDEYSLNHSGLLNLVEKRQQQTFTNKEKTQTSKFQAEVSSLLQRLESKRKDRVKVVLEGSDGVDIAVTVTSAATKNSKMTTKKLAMECYGPTHYVWDGSKLEGRTLMREMLLLKRGGYDLVISIQASNWDRMNIQKRLDLLADAIKLTHL